MTTPNKDAIINALHAFARELRGTLKNNRNSKACKATSDSITASADAAVKAASALERDGIPYVYASIAASIRNEAERVKKIADDSPDLSYADSLRVASIHLMRSALEQMPPVF
jgi:hypothetical protein